VGLLMFLTGLERQSMKVLAWCVLLTGTLCVWIIPRLGIVGAAAASALGFSLWNIWSYQLVVKNLGIHPSIFYALKKFFWPKE
jgi:O-antigen/teichoic acid export membrane protein